jgi:hypothetical protein
MGISLNPAVSAMPIRMHPFLIILPRGGRAKNPIVVGQRGAAAIRTGVA